MDTLIGLSVVILAAIMQGSFMVPMAYVKNWQWENSWALFSLLGMIAFNWMFALMTLADIDDLYTQASASQLAAPVFFGLLWGIGAICFGLGIAAVGLSLGYAVIMGLVLCLGTLLPMILLQPELILTSKGLFVLLGLAVAVVGIVLCGKAGMNKEREQGETAGAITKLSQSSMKAGLAICVIAGIFSCFPNVGYSLSEGLITKAEQLGTAPAWTGTSVWALLFSAGAVANLTYCGYLFLKNGTFMNYFDRHLPRNVFLVGLVSLLWIASFVLYGYGAGLMGVWGTIIGWSVFIALSIGAGGAWGVLQGEWTNTSQQSRKLMIRGLSVIALAVVVLAIGSSQ